MEIDTISVHYRKQIFQIYECLYSQKFKEMEQLLLTLIENIIHDAKEGDVSEQIVVVIFIYSNFNTFFSNWLSKKHRSKMKVIGQLNNNEHHNVLIAHCSDAASMDDLLWEVSNYLEKVNESGRREVEYQLDCYKKSLL